MLVPLSSLLTIVTILLDETKYLGSILEERTSQCLIQSLGMAVKCKSVEIGGLRSIDIFPIIFF